MMVLMAAAALAWAPQEGPDGPVRWLDTQIEWHFAEGTALNSDMASQVRDGFTDWVELGQGAVLFEEVGTIETAEVSFNGRSEVGFASTWDYPRTALAVTQVWIDGDRIVEFDLLLQADPPRGWGDGVLQAHLPSAILHEVGHALGLGHSEVAGAVMFGAIKPGEQRGLHDDDREGLLTIYAETVDSGSASVASSGCSHGGGLWGGWIFVALLSMVRMSGSAESRGGPLSAP
jgi:matrix metalloproteinase-8 (neutrophil collagenase)